MSERDKPWCGRPLPDDRDGWKTRAFAFKDALLETRKELAAANARIAALEGERVELLTERNIWQAEVMAQTARAEVNRDLTRSRNFFMSLWWAQVLKSHEQGWEG